MSETREKVIEITVEVLGVDDNMHVNYSSRLVEDLGADELLVDELVMTLEDELDISLEEPEYTTVGELMEACEVEVRRRGRSTL